MSFALDVKREVLGQEFNKTEALAFIRGIMSSSGVKDGSKTIMKLNNAEISEVIRDMLSQMKLTSTSSKENKNWIIIDGIEQTESITMPGHYFAGAFVGGGSVSDPSSTSYHLEIQLYSNVEAGKIQSFLNKYAFEFIKIQRRKLWVLYIKKSEQIADFLKAIQAFNSLLSFEDARIERDYKNQVNRYSNLDVYNIEKLADASNEFKYLYEEVKARGLYSKFREPELKFFELRYGELYLSLADLVPKLEEKCGIVKTRAGLNHWIIKLRKVVAEAEK